MKQRYTIANCFSAMTLMKRYTSATCFSAFVLPHLLFVDDFQKRNNITMFCCLAWNISLLRSNEQRVQQIESIWKMFETESLRSQSSAQSSDSTEGFTQDLCTLVAQKRDLFPWIRGHILMAELTQKNGRDVLCVKTNGSVEEVELFTQRNSADLPDTMEALERIHRETAAQVDLMRQVRQKGGVFSDIDTTQMAIAYGVQRADLISYRRTLTAWLDAQHESSVQREIERWLNTLDDIEENTKAVLALLTKEQSV
jgi:hypothetical protein